MKKSDAYKAAAIALITEFKVKYDPAKSNVAFPNLEENDKKEFVTDLMIRVEAPEKINQIGVALCGPAAVMFCWVSKRPDLYVKYLINMYEQGEGMMENLRVKPGEDCRTHKPVGIKGIDWVALAALRDSENSVLDLDSEPAMLSGITLPNEIEKWFTNIGFDLVENDTSLLLSKPFATLQKAARYFNEGKSVCLFVNATLFQGQGFMNLSADHWIAMISEPIIDGQSILSMSEEKDMLTKKVDFQVYSWGEARSANDRKYSVQEFLNHFYGFVAAEYHDGSLFEIKLFRLAQETVYVRV